MKKQTILVIIIILIGIMIRIVGIGSLPNALNVDEASAGYEAYSILQNGIDRNGKAFPVFLEAWGSGQNALYSYICIPCILIFGLNAFAIRLPMAIIGSLSLVIFYLLLKRLLGEKKAIIGLIFLTICPWHIMKSRWGLESNLFPDLILLFVYLLVKGLQDNKKWIFYLSFVIAGLSAYSYGTSYMFLPLFIIPLLIILKIKNVIGIKEIIFSLLITALVSLPIILFVIINTFNLNEIKLGIFTIPHLTSNRFKIITSIFGGSFLTTTWNNIKETFKIIFFQSDGLPWNSLKSFGTIYLFSTIFTVIGIITPIYEKFLSKSKTEKEKQQKAKQDIIDKLIDHKVNLSWIFTIWLIVAILIGFICEPNINRLNIIQFPIIYFTILGICYLVEFKNYIGICIGIIYLIYFSLFTYGYSKENWDNYFTFESGLKEVFEYTGELNNDYSKYHFVVTDSIKEPYIYTLFYTKYDSKEFIKTVKYVKGTENAEFRQVESFGNYTFGDKYSADSNEKLVYIFKKDEITIDNPKFFDIKDFGKYLVVVEK